MSSCSSASQDVKNAPPCPRFCIPSNKASIAKSPLFWQLWRLLGHQLITVVWRDRAAHRAGPGPSRWSRGAEAAERPRGGAPAWIRASSSEPGGLRAAAGSSREPCCREVSGTTAPSVAVAYGPGVARPSLALGAHKRLQGLRKLAPEPSRRYLGPEARTCVAANLTSSLGVGTFVPPTASSLVIEKMSS